MCLKILWCDEVVTVEISFSDTEQVEQYDQCDSGGSGCHPMFFSGYGNAFTSLDSPDDKREADAYKYE